MLIYTENKTTVNWEKIILDVVGCNLKYLLS